VGGIFYTALPDATLRYLEAEGFAGSGER